MAGKLIGNNCRRSMDAKTDRQTSYFLSQVARLAGVSVSTVKREIKDGKLKALKLRRSRRVLHSDLIEWLGRDPFGERC